MALDMHVKIKSEKEYIAESLKDAVNEMNAKKEGKLPRRSARDMLKSIKEDMENGNL
ncbi:hypothetical protein [Aquibacillus salsiterrae]|uniref:Uncharacterized protein n=1 Tax=Aquibacillus salsiterrae TaxID=2950439 RepID=A0A9X3WBL1_9BACI|nr:hypothetical protein [Aquibacillus salsiterrae]MDC3416645.1 hypothetical protein [Aquibacillus salsiterrae]